MTQPWPPTRGAYFTSPPSTGLSYPSYTPHPSRTNTPAYPLTSSPASSGDGSFGRGSKVAWKSDKGHKRSQSAPWKTPIGSPPLANNQMSYYQYYQQAPGWGGQQYEPMPPPMPSYQPASNWGGYEYYSAHSGDHDRTLFDSLWGRFKSAIGMTSQGYSRQHSKQIYRRVYGGAVDLLEVPPEELGAAAGYEAIRLWEHHHNLYQTPLNHDLDREREALAGLAIGEANKLWTRANPFRNRRGRRLCAEVAMATAERIFTFQYDQMGGVAPYLSPEQQYANAPLVNNPSLLRNPYGSMEPDYVRPRTVSFGGGGRRSRRGSWSYYDQQPQVVPIGPNSGAVPPVSSIPMGVGGLGGAYQNSHGYNIAPGPHSQMGLPFPGDYGPPSPRYANRGPLGPDPYDDYGVPPGMPSSYGAGGGYGPPMGAPSSVGSGGYGGGYDGGYMPTPGYRRPRARSQGYAGY